jgi:hypothetical protein
LVEIEIVEKDRTKFRVVWRRYGVPYKPYLIESGDMQTASSEIRVQLAALVSNALERDQALATRDTLNAAVAFKNEQDLMKRLVRHCKNLYSALFETANDSGASQSYVDKYIRAELEKESSSKSICFLVPPRVSIPWGLLYEGVLTSDPDPTKPEDFSGFWCLKHQVATIFDALVSPIDFVVTYETEKFHLVWGGDNAEFTKAKRAIKGYGAERKMVAQLLRHYGKPATGSTSLVQAWTENQARLGLLYLFCHADARTLGFSVADTMSVVDFRHGLKKSAASPRCLVFLNGCFTTNPDENGTFLEATGRDGFCGYIGAETEVPALFAFRFGLAFKSLLYRGVEVVDAMGQLRRQHWPLSLIYGLYAFPHLRLEAHPTFGSMSLPIDVNYSHGPLGEKIG